MPYRVRSTDVWHSLPGVVAAYQPIAAPDPFAARQNVAHSGARFGVYTAQPGVAPTWTSATGWTFNGTTQYLSTSIIPQFGSSLLARMRMPVAGSNSLVSAYDTVGPKRFYVVSNHTSPGRLYAYGAILTVVPGISSDCVMGLAAERAYLNGITEGVTAGGALPNSAILFGRTTMSVATFCPGEVKAIVVSFRTFSPAEMWLASRQMAYCEQNPDWNAWARRRRYYYAPSAAAGRVGIYGRRSTVALPGSVSIRGTD